MGKDVLVKLETLSKILNPAIDAWISGHEVYEIAINSMQDWEQENFVDSVIEKIKINESKVRNGEQYGNPKSN